jgi:hypothetical protein
MVYGNVATIAQITRSSVQLRRLQYRIPTTLHEALLCVLEEGTTLCLNKKLS